MEYSIVYVTVQDKAEAEKIGKNLVKARLVACVNIIDKMNSIYWWDGKVNCGEEVVLIAKTKNSLVKEVVASIKKLHSYSCPCIISIPIIDGNPDYLKWIGQETKNLILR